MKIQFAIMPSIHYLETVINRDGYKPKSKFGKDCTSFTVEKILRDTPATHKGGKAMDGSLEKNSPEEIRAIADSFAIMYDKVNKQLQKVNSSSDFFHNCRDACGVLDENRNWKLKDFIWNYQLGFLASMVNNVIKEDKAPPKENLSHLGWIGTEKKRGSFFVKLTEYIENYGLHKVVDKTGNRGIFFSYKMKDHKVGAPHLSVINAGDCFLMTATPSRHQINNYDGGKETYFNRVIIEENKGGT